MKLLFSLAFAGLFPALVSAEMRTLSLSEETAAKMVSLNSDYLVFGGEAGKKSPLLIYLHGAGGVGHNLKKVENQPRRLLATVETLGESCLCVVPQATRSPREHGEKGGWVPVDLDHLIEHLKKSLPIDPNRVYLTGNSMGGYGTIAWAAHSPEHFAAIAPMVGGLGPGGPKDVTPDLESWGKKLREIPMKAYYGGMDRVVPPDRGDLLLKAMKKAGGKHAEVIVLENEGHGAGRVPYGSEDFVKWMFSQKKQRKPTKED